MLRPNPCGRMEEHMNTDDRVQIISSEIVFNDFFRIEKASLRFRKFDGEMSKVVQRLCLHRGDSVAALIFNQDTGMVLLTNQFKYPTYRNGDGWIVEVLAGSVDQGESNEDAMRREILEEAGYRVRDLTEISTFYLSPGGTSERIILYYAEVRNSDHVARGGGVETEGEDIEIREYALSDLWSSLDRGEINDAKTIIALMWLKNRIEKKS